MRFTERARDHVQQFPEIRDLIKARAQALSEPGAASQLGHQCHGELKHCRTVKLGTDHRMVFMVRRSDVVVVAIGKRRDEAAYDVAINVLKSGGVPPEDADPSNRHPPAPPRTRRKRRRKR